MGKEVTEKENEDYKGARYQQERARMMHEWETACACGKQREWYEKTVIAWFDQRGELQHYSDSQTNQAYIDCLQEYMLPEIRDEEYAEMMFGVENYHNIPAYVVVFTRDVLGRKLQMDRNAESVNRLLDWCAKQVETKNGKGIYFPHGQTEPEIGVHFFAESMILTGEVKQDDRISEVEQSILLIAGTEVVGRCIQNGILVKERSEAYIDFAMSNGNRSVLPVLIALKYKEEA